MKEHSINLLDNFICGWYLQDLDLCDEIIEYFDQKEEKFLSGPNTNIKFKTSIDASLDKEDLVFRYVRELGIALQKYKEKYNFCSTAVNYNWGLNEYPNIQCYEPPHGGYPTWHCERGSSKTIQRHLVYMTYLNDVSDGGETEWYYQKLKVKPEKGLTVLWPSDWMFTHKGHSSPTQKKYIVTGWYNALDLVANEFFKRQ